MKKTYVSLISAKKTPKIGDKIKFPTFCSIILKMFQSTTALNPWFTILKERVVE